MASFSSMPLEITSIIVREHFEELADVAVAKHGGLTKGQHVYEARKAIGSLAFSSRGMLDVCTQELNRLADTYDDLMETAYGADQEVVLASTSTLCRCCFGWSVQPRRSSPRTENPISAVVKLV